MSNFDALLERVKKNVYKEASTKNFMTPSGVTQQQYKDVFDDDEFVPVGLNGVMAATEKLLAVNKGVTEPDERDSWQYKRIMTLDKLFRERIKLDADQVRRNIHRRVARHKNLKGIHANIMDSYPKGLLIGNALSQPLEEINPMQLMEAANSVTGMGPGGIGSADAITEEANALHPSSFGFISPIEGPESEKIGIDARLAWGVRIGSDGYPYQRFYDRSKNRYVWLSPKDVADKVIKIPD